MSDKDETLPCGVLPEDPLPATEERVRQKREMDAAIRAALDEARAEERKALREMIHAQLKDGIESVANLLAALDARLRAEKVRVCEHRGDVVCALCQGAEIERLRAESVVEQQYTNSYIKRLHAAEAEVKRLRAELGLWIETCRCAEERAEAAEKKAHAYGETVLSLDGKLQAAEARTAKLVEALERLHYSVFDPYDETDGRLHFCNGCRHQWPCPTSKALAAAKASEMRITVETPEGVGTRVLYDSAAKASEAE